MHRLRTKKKAAPPPEKPRIDLENALPKSDDFRTSLLMPNLAQRFSLLKMEAAAAAAAIEAAKSGSANATTAGPNGYGFSGLKDIAESETASQRRLGSVSDDGRPSEDGGSVMNRPRGGDGNVLFGGRQKVYKVPASKALRGGTSSMEDLNAGSGGSLGGRTYFNYDLPDTTPARVRARDDELVALQTDASTENLEYNKNRYTSSSTNSTPNSTARISTAATSINSQTGQSVSGQSVPQSPTSATSQKPRKALYEQALDQQLQEQQTTAMGRLERLATLTRMRTQSPPPSRSESPFSARPKITPAMSPSLGSPASKHHTPWGTSKTIDSPQSPLSRQPGEQEAAASKADLEGFDFGISATSTDPGPQKSPVRSLASVRDDASDKRSVARGSAISTGTSAFAHQLATDSRNREERGITEGRNNARSTFLSISTTSNRSSLDQDLVIQQLEKELDSPIQSRRAGSSSTDAVSPVKPEEPASLAMSPPTSPARSNASSVSALSVTDNYLLADPIPIINRAISPTSPQFVADSSFDQDDSPTLPPGQGLSLLVRQHLRSDSGGSSMYASSTYTRMSARYSRYAPSEAPPVPSLDANTAAKTLSEPRVSISGSSAGNTWQYEEFEGPAPQAGSEPVSPTSIYPPTIAPKREQTPPRGVPPLPVERERDEPERGRTGPSTGERSPPRQGRDPASRPGSRQRGRAEEDWRSIRDTIRERSLSRPGERTPIDSDRDKDWEQQLAFRRQLIQQNIRNQEKINSQHEMPFTPPENSLAKTNGGTFGALRSKPSNGKLRDATRQQNGAGPVGGGRARLPSDEEQRQRHGPPGMPPMGHGPPRPYGPPNGPPPAPGGPQGRPARPSINTHQPFPPHGLPHPKHNPIKPGAPRLRKLGSREQMNGPPSGGGTPRGQPMGWEDPYGSPRTPGTPRSQPGTPRSGRPYPRPGMHPAEYREDGRGPMSPPNNEVHPAFDPERRQPAVAPRRPHRPTNGSPEGPDLGQHPALVAPEPRPDGRSPIMPSPSPASASIPPSTAVEAPPPTAKSIPKPTPDAQIIEAIKNTNAQYQPPKKRTISKTQISEPTLIKSTSNVPTINLPPKPPSPVTPTSAPPRSRRRTRADTIFGLVKNQSSEHVPETKSDEEDSVEKKKVSTGKLRKSMSDGGALGARARAHDHANMKDSMPRLQKSMVSGPVPIAAGPGATGTMI